MPFAPSRPRRERILLTGPGKVGKTTAWLQIAQWCQKFNTGSTFYVIDSDNAVEAMLEDSELGFDQLDNVVYEVVDEWPEYVEALRTFRGKATRDDWIICDMLSPAWTEARLYYIREVYGQEAADYLLKIRAEKQANSDAHKDKRLGLSGRDDWGWINQLYLPWQNKLTVKSRCHVLCTGMIDKVSDDADKEEKKAAGPGGLKPAGQKRLAHMFHTWLNFYRPYTERPHERRMDTLGDRSRTPLKNESIGNFAVTYLMKVAGWKVVPK